MQAKKSFTHTPRVFILLLLPAVFASLALLYHCFAFKAGVALSGILILAFMAYSHAPVAKTMWLIPAAFLFSVAGDWFLSYRKGDTGMFITGIILFFFAHCGYLAFALKCGKPKINLLVMLLSGYILFFFSCLSPGIESNALRAAAFIYLIVSCISLSAAAGMNRVHSPGKWFFLGGIFLILFSDTLIAFKEFVSCHQLDGLILPTYYLSHICITFAMMMIILKSDK